MSSKTLSDVVRPAVIEHLGDAPHLVAAYLQGAAVLHAAVMQGGKHACD